MEKFSTDYEREHYRHTEANHLVGAATRDLFKSWFPRWTGPLVERGIHAFMDESLIEAFGFPKPTTAMRRAVEASLKLRGRVLRLWPRRRRPLLRTQMTHRSYPRGYAMDTIGPEHGNGGCPFHAPPKPDQ
jgi:hypothetical protein